MKRANNVKGTNKNFEAKGNREIIGFRILAIKLKAQVTINNKIPIGKRANKPVKKADLRDFLELIQTQPRESS